MPAGLPGSTTAQNLANPSAGSTVQYNPFSGPKGSPLDYDVQYPPGTWPNVLTAKPTGASGNASTGALSTGIGFDAEDCVVSATGVNAATKSGIQTNLLGPGLAAAQLGQSGFTDDYIPGTTLPGGTLATTAILTCIGGGRCNASTVAAGGIATPNPYSVQPILDAGNGGSRDAGAGPAFTGFSMKLVTAVADDANGAVIEAGWVNRSGVVLGNGQSQFGSSTAASPAVT